MRQWSGLRAQHLPKTIGAFRQILVVFPRDLFNLPAHQLSKPVFISYAWEDTDARHAVAVRDFADQLRLEGIDVQLDQYHPHGQDDGWEHWCEQLARDSQRVLAIASPAYLRRWWLRMW